MSSRKTLHAFAALVGLTALAGCRPCEVGSLTSLHIADGLSSGQVLLVEGAEQSLSVGVRLGQCASGNLPLPTVQVTSPSGERVPARVDSVKASLADSDLVQMTVGFKEAGNYELQLQFPGRTLTFQALVSRDRVSAPYQSLDGHCADLFVTGPGVMSCHEVIKGPSGLEHGAAIVRDGGIAHRFAVGSRVFPGVGEYWLATADGGLEGYAETGATVVPAPAVGVSVNGRIVDIAPLDGGAWVLTTSTLSWVERGASALAANGSVATPTTVTPVSLLVIAGPVVFVLNQGFVGNASYSFEVEACGYSVEPVSGTVSAIAGSCAVMPGQLVGGDRREGWMLDLGTLRTVAVDELKRSLVTTASLPFPPLSPMLPLPNDVIRRRPVFFRTQSWLVPRRVGAKIETDVYWGMGTETSGAFGISGGDDTFVWGRNTVGPPVTRLISRD